MNEIHIVARLAQGLPAVSVVYGLGLLVQFSLLD